MKFYNLEKIEKKDADINVIFGERSNGKTYACLKRGLEKYVNKGIQTGYIRRMSEDIKSSIASNLYAALVINGEVEKITGGEYNDVKYYRGAWYLATEDSRAPEPFAYAFALSQMEHYKSQSYPKVDHIIFDEFTTRRQYLPDEVALFFNTLSTIIRQRDTAKVYLLGNTVNKYCPYFKVFDININKIRQGEIELKEYDNNGIKTKVAVEYTGMTGGKKSDKYFNFKNKTVSMITNGAWEVASYPKCPVKYKADDIITRVFLTFDGDYIASDVVNVNGNMFIFWYRKKTQYIQEPESDIVFCDYSDYHRNYYSNITRPRDDLTRLIYSLFASGKVFYADDDTGEILRNYIAYSVSEQGMLRT